MAVAAATFFHPVPYGNMHAVARVVFLFLVAGVLPVLAGCGPARPRMAKVSGRVLLDGKPLEFGSVMFQPQAGQPARGDIRPDGTFTLSTYKPGDGAAVGRHMVRITCYEGQSDPVGQASDLERPLGPSRIPARYNLFDTSGIEIEVHDTNPEVVLELASGE